MARYAIQEFGMSERQACRAIQLSRCGDRYQAKRTRDEPLVQPLCQLADKQPRWGCGKMIDYLRNEGHAWNHKRIGRVYRALSLHLKRKPKKRLPARAAQTLAVPEQRNQTWSLDFMSDALSTGRTFRTLNILDDFNREALWIEVDTSLPAERLVRVVEQLLSWRGKPRSIRMDYGPELISQRLESWAKEKQIELLHIQPAYIERFNRTDRKEVLDAYLFDDLQEVRYITEHWLEEYNTIRPLKRRCLIPPTSPHQGATRRVTRAVGRLKNKSNCMKRYSLTQIPTDCKVLGGLSELN